MRIPGLVDLQVNGYQGVDFSSEDLNERDLVRACRNILETGTSAFLATMITSPSHVYQQNLEVMAKVMEKDEFAGRVLGIHLEGPFISAQEGARGVHKSEWVRKPDIGYLEHLISIAGDRVKLITIAAELEGAEKLAWYAVSRGITVSLGHQMSDEQDLEKLVQAGASALTHLGNGVPAVLARHNNPIWAGLGEDELWAMIISDGHHLPPAVLKTIIRTKGASRCIVVSDSSPVAGLPPGHYNASGSDIVLERTGRLYNPHTGYLAGSSATMLDCMNWLATLKLVSQNDLIAMGFYNPLKLIGLDAQDVAEGQDIRFDEKRGRFCLRK